MENNIIKNVKITPAVVPSDGVAASTILYGEILDMANFESVLMVVTFGVITAGAVTTIKAQQDSAVGGGTMADLLGSSQTVAADADDETFYIDLVKPIERYVRLAIPRATQNAVVSSATYIQYNPRNKPTTQASTVSGELLVEPVEGTA